MSKSKKPILWTLVLVAIVAVAGTAVWQHQVRKREAGLAAQAARKNKAKTDHADKPANNRPAPPKQEPKATVMSSASKEHLAEKAFIASLRAVFIWRSTSRQRAPRPAKRCSKNSPRSLRRHPIGT